ncbi:MAG TPA: ABC transporter permease [Longimicrobiales bacterium]|nr:ABC transporter permease [Longimicrobiales bacterium]
MGEVLRRLGPAWTAILALAGTVVVAGLMLVAGGYDALLAGRALVSGAVGTPDAFLSVTLVRAVPLILTGLAVALAFRAGVWNIGAEGQLYAGAVAGAWVGLSGGNLPGWILVPAVLAASCGAGMAWALVPTVMKLRLGVGEVITTLLMNFVGINLAAYAVHGPLQEARGVFPQTDPIAMSARLPALAPGSRLHVGFVVAVALAALLWGVLRWTRAGFVLRAVGASPGAARVAGRVNVPRAVLVAFLASGALAGLAGGVEVSGVTFALYEGLSPGWGYTAIAVALLAGLHPGAVVVTGILFGALEGGAGSMQRVAGIPATWVSAVEALVILSVLAVDQLRRRVVREGSHG